MGMTLKQIAEKHGLTPEGIDYALSQYQTVISEITHGMMSKLSYDAHDVLQVAQERWCDTCELLKAQEPLEPVIVNGEPECAECLYELRSDADSYCPCCGRKVKWE